MKCAKTLFGFLLLDGTCPVADAYVSTKVLRMSTTDSFVFIIDITKHNGAHSLAGLVHKKRNRKSRPRLKNPVMLNASGR